jgi:hypothetical protein
MWPEVGLNKLVPKLSELRVGTRWQSVTCDTQAVVVRVPPGGAAAELRCGGLAMVPVGADGERQDVRPHFDQGSLLGKRYYDSTDAFEVLCTMGGSDRCR